MKRNIAFFSMLIGMIFSLTVCGGGGGGGNANTPAAPATPVPPVTPSPLSVIVSLDTGLTTSVLVTASSGTTITAIGADGTVYTLAVPANAVTEDTLISLTPVASISGLPFSGGMLAAVQFEPDGLSLLAPAVLSMVLPTAPSASSVMSFGYVGAGEEIYLRPETVSGATITISISHFSGAGSGAGTQGDRSTMNGHPPTDTRDQAEQDLANLISKAKSENRMPTDDELEAVLRAWYDTSIRPKLTAAETDDSRFMCAVSEFLSWYKMIELFYTGSCSGSLANCELQDQTNNTLRWRFHKELDKSFISMGKAHVNAFDKAYEKCKADPLWDSSIIQISKYASLISAASLYGTDYSSYYNTAVPVTGYIGDLQNVAFDRIQKCDRFAVTIDSIIDYRASDNSQSSHEHFVATSKAFFDVTDQKIRASITTPATTLTVDNYVAALDPPSWTDNYTAEATFMVNLLYINGGRKSLCSCGAKPKDPPPPDIWLYYTPETQTTGAWIFNYMSYFHLNDMNPFDAWPLLGKFYAIDFVKGDAGYFAKKTYSQTINSSFDTKSEDTLITIKHVPKTP